MIKNLHTRRTIALFFIFSFLNTLVPYNSLFGQNNGPNAPEAAAFEPVDATDMVNLLTGDMTYVLPLLNVSSPEGGYPLALSYHGGIAMDQEASWVGLGWSLNPGAINRSVNGQPDDWGNTDITEFFYDEGWEGDYYSFSIGGTLPNGISLGLGASWDSEKSFGGFVSLGYMGSMMSYSSHGGIYAKLGIGVGKYLSFGVDSDLAYSVGVSKRNTGSFNLNSQHGLTLKSQGVTLNSSEGLGYRGTSISKGTSKDSSVNENDYFIIDRTNAFGIDIGFFWAKYQHRHIEYSLYKKEVSNATGTLYPSEGLNVNADLQEEDTSMDVYQMSLYNLEVNESGAEDVYTTGETSIKDYDFRTSYNGDASPPWGSNNFMMFAKDNYAVHSQGMSGTFSPYIFEELPVYSFSKDIKAPTSYDDVYRYYDTDYIMPSTIGEIKPFFYFDNEKSSFLRINKGELVTDNLTTPTSTDEILSYYTKVPENIYDINYGPNGELLRFDGKKRTGNVISFYTNEEIREGNKINFIDFWENSSRLNRSNKETYLDDGIGAFQITAIDGKTYHYSLPVHNFEEFSRNFNEDNEEDEAFYEKIKTKPYATHWLLTAVTGPDYIDFNNNGKVDSSDYGYWVEFDYGKWSDGYGWRTPKEGYANFNGTNSYRIGRKQVYYLDAIKTRTHSAIFVKSLRRDGVSSDVFRGEKEYYSGEFDATYYAKNFIGKQSKKMVFDSDFYYSGIDGRLLSVDELLNRDVVSSDYGQPAHIEYIDMPKNYSLKLSKILLIENSELTKIGKSNGSELTSRVNGNIQLNTGYLSWSFLALRNENILNNFESHFSDNIYDENDLLNSNIKSIKSLCFSYDYELASQTANSEDSNKGRLGLKELIVQGNNETQVYPSYKFSYINNDIYDKDMIDDWGYYKGFPQQWSLNEIQTPTGSKIKVNYESDSFFAEAAFTEEETSGPNFNFYSEPYIESNQEFDLSLRILDLILESENFVKFTFAPEDINLGEYNLKDNFKIGDKSYIVIRRPDGSILSQEYGVVEVINGDEIKMRFEENIESTVLSYAKSEGFIQVRNSLSMISNNYATFANPNGREGGGIRVSSVESISEDFTAEEVFYDYSDLEGLISGITTYEPLAEEKASRISIPFVTEIPGPKVYYSNVKVFKKDKDLNFLEGTKYNFETFNRADYFTNYSNSDVLYKLGNIVTVKWNSGISYIAQNLASHANNFTVENKTSNLGRLLSTELYNKENQMISRVENKYKSELDSHGELGVSQETFRNSRVFKYDVGNSALDLTSYHVANSSKINYPSVLESVTETTGGFSVTKTFDKHDFLTGQVLETSTYASDGIAFKTKIVPAYKKYSAMGSKVDDVNNKNMLSQSAGEYSYVLDENGEEELIGVGITTWNNNWTYQFNDNRTETTNEVWRKHKSYVWNGVSEEGVYTGFTDNFNWGINATQTSDWKKTSETTRYNQFSSPLEVKDINDNYAATKMGDDYTKVIATSNAAYDDMYYSGAEYIDAEDTSYFDGGIKSAGYIDVSNSDGTSEAHTGNFVVEINSGEKGFEVQVPGRDLRNTPLKERFKVSVWVEKGKESVVKILLNNAQVAFKDSEKVYAGDWVLLTGYISIRTAGANVAITSTSGTVRLDDFRLHPISSSMSSYVYNEWDEVSYIMGANGLSTHYIYDAAGRLKETWSEVIDNTTGGIIGGFKKVSTNSYNYKNQ